MCSPRESLRYGIPYWEGGRRSSLLVSSSFRILGPFKIESCCCRRPAKNKQKENESKIWLARPLAQEGKYIGNRILLGRVCIFILFLTRSVSCGIRLLLSIFAVAAYIVLEEMAQLCSADVGASPDCVKAKSRNVGRPPLCTLHTCVHTHVFKILFTPG